MKIIFVSGFATGNEIWDNVIKEPTFQPFLSTHNVTCLTWLDAINGIKIPTDSLIVGWSLGAMLLEELITENTKMLLLSSVPSVIKTLNNIGFSEGDFDTMEQGLIENRDLFLKSFFKNAGCNATLADQLVDNAKQFTTEDLLIGLKRLRGINNNNKLRHNALRLHGEDDRIFNLLMAKQYYKNLVIIPNVGHMLPIFCPNIVAQAILQLTKL